MSKQIQWFPGHMSKTLREFKEIKNDLYLLLLDSRAPKSSFIDSFKEIIENKKVIIIFTKLDLVNKKDLELWISQYKKNFSNIFAFDFHNSKLTKSKILEILDKQQFKSLLPKIIILGIPNVGKSTLLNILTDKKRAKVENRPGITKTTNWYQFNKKYWILDSPGILEPKFINDEQAINLSLIGSIKLELLPLEKISVSLITKLIELKIIDFSNAEDYIYQLINESKKTPDDVYRKIIKDYQNLKYGRIILD